jgi:hypothetical protein
MDDIIIGNAQGVAELASSDIALQLKKLRQYVPDPKSSR